MFNYGTGSSAFSNNNCVKTSHFFHPQSIDMSDPTAMEGVAGMYNYNIDLTMTEDTSRVTDQRQDSEQTEIVFEEAATVSTDDRGRPANTNNADEPMLRGRGGFVLPQLRQRKPPGPFLSSFRANNTPESSVKTHMGKGRKPNKRGGRIESESLSSRIPYVTRSKQQQQQLLQNRSEDRSTSTRQSLQKRLMDYRRNNDKPALSVEREDYPGEADDSIVSGLPDFQRPQQATFSSDSSWNLDDELRLRRLTKEMEPVTAPRRGNTRLAKDIPARARNKDSASDRRERILNDVFSDLTHEEEMADEGMDSVDSSPTSAGTLQSRLAKLRNSKDFPQSQLRKNFNLHSSKQQVHSPRVPATRRQKQQEQRQKTPRLHQPQSSAQTTAVQSSSPDLSHMISDRLHHLSCLYNQRKKIHEETTKRKPGTSSPSLASLPNNSMVCETTETTTPGTPDKSISHRQVQVEEASDVVEVIRIPSVATQLSDLPQKRASDEASSTGNFQSLSQEESTGGLLSFSRDASACNPQPLSLVSSSGLHSPPTIVRRIPIKANGKGPRPVNGATPATDSRGPAYAIFEQAVQAGNQGGVYSMQQIQQAFGLGKLGGPSAFVPVAAAPMLGIEEANSLKGKEILRKENPFDLVSPITTYTDHFAPNQPPGLSPPRHKGQSKRESIQQEEVVDSRYHPPELSPPQHAQHSHESAMETTQYEDSARCRHHQSRLSPLHHTRSRGQPTKESIQHDQNAHYPYHPAGMNHLQYTQHLRMSTVENNQHEEVDQPRNHHLMQSHLEKQPIRPLIKESIRHEESLRSDHGHRSFEKFANREGANSQYQHLLQVFANLDQRISREEQLLSNEDPLIRDKILENIRHDIEQLTIKTTQDQTAQITHTSMQDSASIEASEVLNQASTQEMTSSLGQEMPNKYPTPVNSGHGSHQQRPSPPTHEMGFIRSPEEVTETSTTQELQRSSPPAHDIDSIRSPEEVTETSTIQELLGWEPAFSGNLGHQQHPSPPTHGLDAIGSRSPVAHLPTDDGMELIGIPEDATETPTQELASNKSTDEAWFSKEGDHPIVVEKESKHELQKLRDTLRKILQIEPRIRREIELDELLQGDMHTEEELTHVLSGLAEEQSVKVMSFAVRGDSNLKDPDGVMATNIGDISASLRRIREARGKLDPEEQRFRRFEGQQRRQEPEGKTTIPTTRRVLQNLESMSASQFSIEHDDRSIPHTAKERVEDVGRTPDSPLQHARGMQTINGQPSGGYPSRHQDIGRPRSTLSEFFASVSAQGSSPKAFMSEGSSQSRPIFVSEDGEDYLVCDGHDDLFHRLGGVYTPARHGAPLDQGGRYDFRLTRDGGKSYQHSDQQQEEIMFVDETEEGVICIQNERDDWVETARSAQDFRDDSLVSHHEKDYRYNQSRGASYYRGGSPSIGPDEPRAGTNAWKHRGPHQKSHDDPSGERLHIYHMAEYPSREQPVSRDVVCRMYGVRRDGTNAPSLRSSETAASVCGESIPSVIFASKELKEEHQRQSFTVEQRQDIIASTKHTSERRTPASTECRRDQQKTSDSQQPDAGTPALGQQEELEMEQAIRDLKSKQIPSITYKKIMMGLRQVQIVDSTDDGSDGGASIDNDFFKKDQVSANEFDKVVQALSEAQVISVPRLGDEETTQNQDDFTASSLDADTELRIEPPEIDRIATVDSMMCIKGVRKGKLPTSNTRESTSEGGMDSGSANMQSRDSSCSGHFSESLTTEYAETEEAYAVSDAGGPKMSHSSVSAHSQRECFRRGAIDPSQCGSLSYQRDHLSLNIQPPQTPSQSRDSRQALRNQSTPTKKLPKNPTRITRDPPTRPEISLPGTGRTWPLPSKNYSSTDPPLRQKKSADPPSQLMTTGADIQKCDSNASSPMARKARAAMDRKRKITNKANLGTPSALSTTPTFSPVRDTKEPYEGEEENDIFHGREREELAALNSSAPTQFPWRGDGKEKAQTRTTRKRMSPWSPLTTDFTGEQSSNEEGKARTSGKLERLKARARKAEEHIEARKKRGNLPCTGETTEKRSRQDEKRPQTTSKLEQLRARARKAEKEKEGPLPRLNYLHEEQSREGNTRPKRIMKLEQPKTNARKAKENKTRQKEGKVQSIEDKTKGKLEHYLANTDRDQTDAGAKMPETFKYMNIQPADQKSASSLARKAGVELSQISKSVAALQGLQESTTIAKDNPSVTKCEKKQSREAPSKTKLFRLQTRIDEIKDKVIFSRRRGGTLRTKARGKGNPRFHSGETASKDALSIRTETDYAENSTQKVTDNLISRHQLQNHEACQSKWFDQSSGASQNKRQSPSENGSRQVHASPPAEDGLNDRRTDCESPQFQAANQSILSDESSFAPQQNNGEATFRDEPKPCYTSASAERGYRNTKTDHPLKTEAQLKSCGFVRRDKRENKSRQLTTSKENLESQTFQTPFDKASLRKGMLARKIEMRRPNYSLSVATEATRQDLMRRRKEWMAGGEDHSTEQPFKAANNFKHSDEGTRSDREMLHSPEAATPSADTAVTSNEAKPQKNRPPKLGKRGAEGTSCGPDLSLGRRSYQRSNSMGSVEAPEIFKRAFLKTNGLPRDKSIARTSTSKDGASFDDTTNQTFSQEVSGSGCNNLSPRGSSFESQSTKPVTSDLPEQDTDTSSLLEQDDDSTTTAEEIHAVLYEEGVDEVIPWSGADGVEIILSQATESYHTSIDGMSQLDQSIVKSETASGPGIKKEKLGEAHSSRHDSECDTTRSSGESLTESADRLVGMVLQVRKDEKSSCENEATPDDKNDEAGFVPPFDFAEFPRNSANNVCKQKEIDGRVKALSTEGSISHKSNVHDKACSETTDSIRNHMEISDLQRSFIEEQRLARGAIANSDCQAKVDLFKKKLEAASKFSIVGKEIIPRNRLRRGKHEPSLIPRHPGSSKKKSEQRQHGQKPKQNDCVGDDVGASQDANDQRQTAGHSELPQPTVSKTSEHEQKLATAAQRQRLSPTEQWENNAPTADESSHDGTAESSELFGDRYVDNDFGHEGAHDKIRVVKEDIENVRSRLRKKRAQKANSQRVAHPPLGGKKQLDHILLLRKKEEEKLEDAAFNREIIEVQTDSFSLPTCFEPKRDDSVNLMRRRVLDQEMNGRSTSKFRKGDHDTTSTLVVTTPSHSELLKQQLDIVEAAERAEKRVREGLEKMKKGLADNKKVKLSIERSRRKQASESPKPKKASAGMFEGFGIFSWLKN